VGIVEAGQQVDLVEQVASAACDLPQPVAPPISAWCDRRFADQTSGFIDRMTGRSFGHMSISGSSVEQPRNSGESMNSSMVTGIFFMRPMALKNSGFSWSISCSRRV
jgi:hypothetical protein